MVDAFSRVDVFSRVKRAMVDQLSIQEEGKIQLGAHIINDLNADSLDFVELVMALEEEFGIEIPDGDVETVATVADIVSYIESKLENK